MNIKEIKSTIVTELKAYSKAHGLNRNQLAQKLETTRSVLSRVMDPHNPSINFDLLVRIAHLLDIHIEITIEDARE